MLGNMVFKDIILCKEPEITPRVLIFSLTFLVAFSPDKVGFGFKSQYQFFN